MRAAWWWIDRWRKSTAYTDMTLAEQGAYRNLLDELWLRDGLLPHDDKILAKISGGPFEWAACREKVLAHFVRTKDGYRNSTHDEVMAESKKRAEKQKRYRERRNADPSPDAVAVAQYLRDAILSHSPNHACGRNGLPHDWAKDIDLAIRLDGRAPDALRRAIDFAHKRPDDTFWRANILSGRKLREKYDTMAIQHGR